MANPLDASARIHALSYSPPTVSSKIQNLQKIYFVAGHPISSICLAFTDEKTRNAAHNVFNGYKFFHPSIPLSEKLEDEHCLTIELQPMIVGDKGFFNCIQRLLARLGQQLENSEQATNIPILLAFDNTY